ncbi:MAG: M23 family metallopeptidase [Bacteroidota bacterium]
MAEENQSTNSRWEDWKERLATTYRLVIINDDTFEEVNTTKLTLANLYTIGSSLLVAMAFLVFLLIIFTPLKRFIPGYGDFDAREKAIELERKIEGLESQVASYEMWTTNIRNIMTGKVDSTGALVATEAPTAIEDRILNVDKVPEDEDLRTAVVEEINDASAKVVNLGLQQKPLEQLFFTPPLTGNVTQGFIPDKRHFGVDITAPKNTPIKSIMAGFVISSDWTLETGNTICIQHADNLVSFYKHNSVLLKKVGETVKAGEAIAIIGNTGDHTTGPHLHFELWHRGKPIDPWNYVNFN